MNRPGFDNITAVKENRVYLVAPDICDRSCNAIGYRLPGQMVPP